MDIECLRALNNLLAKRQSGRDARCTKSHARILLGRGNMSDFLSSLLYQTLFDVMVQLIE